jgi:N-acetylglucosamine-6-phosphate deacetylase
MLPRRGVTAFCPTSVACDAATLEGFLASVASARHQPAPGAARVLPAHLESNFISPAYAGAQPLEFVCAPPPTLGQPSDTWARSDGARVLRVLERFRPDVAVVTVAPEIEGGMDLVRWLVARGWIVSLGHSAATFEQAMNAIDAGARQATHLFNRMPPLSHRAPGLVGAVLSSGAVTAELICDGHHVHPAVVRTTIAAKGLHKVVAISDGTAGSGCPVGTTVRLGGRAIVVGSEACFLSDGTTLAGSCSAMDDAFRFLAGPVGLSPTQAAYLCSTSASRHLGMQGFGVIGPGAPADLVLLDRRFRVVRTLVAGHWGERGA